MPATINGIGTHYFGSSNKETEKGFCEFCQREAKLSNYETRTWFVFLFIPIIPLGKKKIFNYCSKCRQHLAMPLSEWEELEEREISTGIERLSQNRNDPNVALEVFGTLLSFNKNEEAQELADSMEEKFPENVDVQIALGSWHEQQNRNIQADKCFERAYKADPDNPGSIRAMGVTKLNNGQIEEAKKLLDQLQSPSPGYDPAIFFSLATKYQELDDHPAALQEYKKLGETHPELLHDKNYRTLVKKSENALGVTQSSLPKKSLFGSKGFLVTAAVFFLFVTLALYNYKISQSQTVHILNGLETPITVLINGSEKVIVPALTRKEISIPEGRHKVAVESPAELKTEYSFEIDSSYFGRFVNRPAFVLDPTQTAYTYWEKIYYREVPVQGEYESKDFVGKKFLSLKHVDYPFKEFPEEIDLGKSNLVTKTGLTFYTDASPEDSIYEGNQGLSFSDQITYGKNHLKMDPENSFLLHSLYELCENSNQKSKGEEILNVIFEKRPIIVESHELKRQKSNDDEIERLKKIYDKELETNSDNSMLLYLRSRLEGRLSDAKTITEKALKANPQNAYALDFQALQLATTGQLEKAMLAKREAVKIDEEFWDYENSYSIGGRDFDSIINEASEAIRKNPDSIYEYQRLLRFYCNQGDINGASKTLEKIMALNTKEEYLSRYFENSKHMSEILFDYAFNQGKNSIALSNKHKIPRSKMEAEIEMGKPVDADKFEEFFYGDDLIIALLASALSNPETREQHIKKAIEKLKEDEPNKRFLAETLEKSLKNNVDWNDVEDLMLSPPLKAVTLTVLKDKVAKAHREKLKDLVIRLNYLKEFPHNLIKSKIMGQPLFTDKTPLDAFNEKNKASDTKPITPLKLKGAISGGAGQFRGNIPSNSN